MTRMHYLQKTSALGDDWARTDIVLSSPETDRTLSLKFWSDHMGVVKSVQIGDLLTAYAMETKEDKDKIELNSTDQTVIEVIYIYYKLLMWIIKTSRVEY